MTISSNNRKAGPFVGNGTASNFAFTFKVFQASDLLVVRLNTTTGVETTLTLTTDYTVALNDDQNSNPGGSITLVAGALATGFNLVITSDIENLQPTDLTNQGGFYPEVISDSLDRSTIQIQQLQDQLNRSIITPVSDAAGNLALPSSIFRANKIFSFDASGAPAVTQIAFPSSLVATYYPRVDSAGSAYELRAPATVRSDIGADNATNLTSGTVADARLPSTMAGKTLTSVSITSGSITGITDLAIADGGTGASTALNARANLGLTIGTNVQAFNPNLQAIANLSFAGANEKFVYFTTAGNAGTLVIENYAQTLLGYNSDNQWRTGLGLGNLATANTINNGNWSGTDLSILNGGTGASDAPTARTNLGATTVGSNLFTLPNPAAITFLRVNADNTVSALDAATFRTAIGATGTGTVTSVDVSGGTTGLTTSGGPVTGSGTITLAGTLAITNGGTGATSQQTAINALAGAVTAGQFLRGNGTNVLMSAIQVSDVPTLNQNTTGTASNVTGTVAVANGGTGATTAPTARTNLGATTVGSNLFTLTNPSAITFPRFNADNTVSALDAATFRTAIGAGTGNGTVTGVTATSPVASSGGAAPVISLNSAYGDTLNPYASKTANFVLAAPNGTAGAPTFRALVAADIPTLNQNTTGTASNVTGTVAVANGGTGQTSYTDGQLLIGNTTGNTLAKATLTQGSGVAITNGAGSITVAVDSTVATLTGTQTLTNKRVTPRSVDIASATTITATSDTADQYEVTALAAAATVAAPSGTPTDGQRLVLRIKDNGTARALTWTTGSSGAFRVIGTSLPTSTVANKTMYVGCIYNAADLRWDVVAVAQEA